MQLFHSTGNHLKPQQVIKMLLAARAECIQGKDMGKGHVAGSALLGMGKCMKGMLTMKKKTHTRLFWFWGGGAGKGWQSYAQGLLFSATRYWTQVHCGTGIPEDASFWSNEELRNSKPCRIHHAVVSGEGRQKKQGPHIDVVSFAMRLDLRGILTKPHWHPGLKTAVWLLGRMSWAKSVAQSAWPKTP